MSNELISAARAGNLEEVRHLLAQPGVDLEYKNCNDSTALIIAAENGHPGVVEVLLVRVLG